MGVFEQFPFTNFHDLNLDWIMRALRELESEVKNFVSINAIKYANPIKWDITRQYEKNTVVLDNSGNAYLSVQPVPEGVNLDRTDFWTNIGNFSALWGNVKKAITPIDEGHNKTASAARSVNTLVWVDDNLLEVIKPMSAGDRYDTNPDGNSRTYNMQMLLNALLGEIHDRENNFTVLEADIENETTQRKAADVQLENSIQNETTARTAADTAINAEISDIKSTMFPIQTAGTYAYRYIDGVYGNDDNDGLTAATAWKSLQKWLDLLARGYNDIRCHIIASGVYKVDGFAFSNAAIHMIGDAGLAIEVHFTVQEHSVAFYSSHLNFQNVTLGFDSPTDYRIYFENCSIGFQNVSFDYEREAYFMGCGITSANISANRLSFTGCSGYINGITITNYNPNYSAIYVTQSNMRLYGNLNLNDLSAAGINNAIYAVNFSMLSIMPNVIGTLENKYANSMIVNNSIAYCTNNRQNALHDRSQAGPLNTNSILIGTETVIANAVQSTNSVRYYQNKLQYYNGTTWTDVPTT